MTPVFVQCSFKVRSYEWGKKNRQKWKHLSVHAPSYSFQSLREGFIASSLPPIGIGEKVVCYNILFGIQQKLMPYMRRGTKYIPIIVYWIDRHFLECCRLICLCGHLSSFIAPHLWRDPVKETMCPEFSIKISSLICLCFTPTLPRHHKALFYIIQPLFMIYLLWVCFCQVMKL